MGVGATNCNKNTSVFHQGSFYLFIIQESCQSQPNERDRPGSRYEDVHGEGRQRQQHTTVLQTTDNPNSQDTTANRQQQVNPLGGKTPICYWIHVRSRWVLAGFRFCLEKDSSGYRVNGTGCVLCAHWHTCAKCWAEWFCLSSERWSGWASYSKWEMLAQIRSVFLLLFFDAGCTKLS